MSKSYAFIAAMLLCASAWAQNTATVKGKLTDSTGKQSLKDATITILNAKDSALEVFGLAKEDGTFTINNISFGERLVQIRFSGYETIWRKFVFSKANANMDLGTIYMSEAANDLGNVTVTQSAVLVKKDTTEFTASAFKTKPNAAGEDVLKKMPGMEVDKDGNIKAQGEAVQKILVNGKEFFGNDPRMATRNLPADVIDKIQVFDDQSDQAKFSGFDDGNRIRTINITTKRDMRKGSFGKFVVGGGVSGDNDNPGTKYQESMSLTRMDGDRQITFTGQANNINKQDFSPRDFLGGGGSGFGGGGFGGGGGGMMMMGGGGNRGGGGGGGNRGGGGSGGSGITNALGAGINYRDAWGTKVDAYGSYFYSRPKVTTQTLNFRENIASTNSDSTTKITSNSSSVNINESHNLTFNLEARVDSSNTFIFRPNLGIQHSWPNSASLETSLGYLKSGNTSSPVYKSESRTTGRTNGYNINNTNLTYRHRFAKPGRTLSLDLRFSANKSEGETFKYSENTFYQLGTSDTLNQHRVDTSRSYSFSPTISFTEAVGKHSMIELRYGFSHSNSESQSRTYRFDNASGKFATFDSLFSNSYDYATTSNTANLSYRYQSTKYNFTLSSGLQFMNIFSNNTTKNVIIERDFVNFTPTANFTYNFTTKKSLRIFYNGRTGQPSTSQLQPVTTTSDNINFQIGNPDLRPSFNHSMRVLYNSFDAFTGKIFFATINAGMTTNDIQSSVIQSTNGGGGQTTTYVNLNGTFNVSGYFNYGFPVKSPKSNLSFQTNVSYSQSQSLLTNKFYTNAHSYNKNTTLSETIQWTTNLANNFDMNFRGTYSYSPVRNSLSPQNNTNYTQATIGTDFTLYSNSGWQLSSDIDYSHYGGRPAGFTNNVLLVTPAVAKLFGKRKEIELKLSCFDIFKQNVAITAASPTATQLQNITQTNTLTRYFMLTFTYNLRSMLGGQQQQRGPGGMPGMRMNGQGGGNWNGGGGNFGGGNRRGG